MASGQATWTEVTEEAVDPVLAVDIKGTMLMVHEFGQRMVQRGGGAIVYVGSTVIVRGSPRAPQYAAGKYGRLGVTKSYAKALAPTVRVYTFAPGFMETEALLARPEWQAGRRDAGAFRHPGGKNPQAGGHDRSCPLPGERGLDRSVRMCAGGLDRSLSVRIRGNTRSSAGPDRRIDSRRLDEHASNA